jgi:hypothetical protein
MKGSPEWVDGTQELPPEGEPVLVAERYMDFDSTGAPMRWRQLVTHRVRGTDHWAHGGKGHPCVGSFWMPLPDYPRPRD